MALRPNSFVTVYTNTLYTDPRNRIALAQNSADNTATSLSLAQELETRHEEEISTSPLDLYLLSLSTIFFTDNFGQLWR